MSQKGKGKDGIEWWKREWNGMGKKRGC